MPPPRKLVRYLNWDNDIAGQHERVFTHLHSPETSRRREGGDDVSVYSVLDNKQKVIGQVEGGVVGNPFVKADLRQLEVHINNPPNQSGKRGKTRNLFIAGMPLPTDSVEDDDDHPLIIRPGQVKLGDSGTDIFKAKTESGIVRPGRGTPLHRRLGEQFEGIVVPTQPSVSPVFGRAARFGRSGFRVISPGTD
jgi:hypothetical protein